MLNAMLCFFFVVLYFRVHAIKTFFSPTWESTINYNETLFPPAFAFASGGGFTDSALAKFKYFTKCTFPLHVETGSNDCPTAAFNSSDISLFANSSAYGHINARIFDPRELQSNNNYTDLSDRVLLQVSLSCMYKLDMI